MFLPSNYFIVVRVISISCFSYLVASEIDLIHLQDNQLCKKAVNIFVVLCRHMPQISLVFRRHLGKRMAISFQSLEIKNVMKFSSWGF